MRLSPVQRILAICLVIMALPSVIIAQSGDRQPAGSSAKDGTKVHVGAWLVLGPFSSPAPAFSGEGGQKFDAAKLLGYEELATETLKPVEGGTIELPLGLKIPWKSATCDTNGVPLEPSAQEPAVAYLAAYVEVPRWMKVGLKARATDAFRVLLDDAEMLKRDAGGAFKDVKAGEAKLERGKHLLLVKTAHIPGDSVKDWRIDLSISFDGSAGDGPSLSRSSEREISLRDILEATRMTSVAVSPDGSLLAVTTGTYEQPEGKFRSWVEIRRASDGSLVSTLRDVTGISDAQWAPVGRRLSYVVMAADGKKSIRVLDLEKGAITSILENVKELDGYTWAPSGRFIVYSITEKPEPGKTGLTRIAAIQERWSYGKDRSYLYVSSVPGGATRRLTAGTHSSGIADVHPDGKHILFTREYEELSERPYGVSELLTMNLDDGSVDLLWKGHWLRSASYSPDGSKIIIIGGPSTFGDIGKNVPAGTIPNDYDGQLYLFDPATKKVEALSRDFDPAIESAFWSKVDGNVYLTVEERSYRNLYRYSPKKKSYERINVGCQVIERGGIAHDRLAAAYIGSGATLPPRLYSVDLARGKSRMIYDPSAENLAYVRQGGVEDWSFTTSTGKTIDGYYYLPPAFDPQKKYPCIVYYYGGTSPTSRNFGGRYPKNLWAAEGYIVYVLQPSGATGFGQEFSALHVNDWGKIVSEEIIEGARKFTDAHPFVDGTKLGCIGASYGGFMTELLVTKTDLFAAAVSHAGISSISSYWGAGYWGFSYNAVAAAGSFPWNRKDIYVEQSPLFSADKVKTPILLLHGTEDTNVPTNESEQFFTALKLLGKTVEYVRVEGQNHAIMDYNKRTVWSKTIMAWFDRWLKGEPGWWNDLYPPPEGAETAPAGGTESGATSTASPPPDIGFTAVAKKDGSTVLVGQVTRNDIVKNIAGWDEEYFSYEPNDTIIGELAGRLGGVKLIVVLGTWCSDSHREVPRLWKVLETAGFPPENVKMLAVERAKATADSALSQTLIDWSKQTRQYYGITAVESIIVYRDGVELGRIVEAPAKSIEADLLDILKK